MLWRQKRNHHMRRGLRVLGLHWYLWRLSTERCWVLTVCQMGLFNYGTIFIQGGKHPLSGCVKPHPCHRVYWRLVAVLVSGDHQLCATASVNIINWDRTRLGITELVEPGRRDSVGQTPSKTGYWRAGKRQSNPQAC